jgi:hypothetical protein
MCIVTACFACLLPALQPIGTFIDAILDEIGGQEFVVSMCRSANWLSLHGILEHHSLRTRGARGCMPRRQESEPCPK